MKNIAKITHFWHGVKCYFTCISNTQYIILLPNMNKINTFFSEISQQTTQMYLKSGHNYSNLAENQMLFYKHERP